MRAKLVTLGVAVVVVAALVFEVSTVTFANQENANKPAAPAKAKKKRTRKAGNKSRMMSGVPMGVENCLSHLAQMAAADPLIDYEGHPSEIINNGLLWNDPKSKCAVTDEAQRGKVFELANAWRMKDAAKVRSLLQEMGASSSAGSAAQPADTSSAEPAAATPRKPRRSRRKAATPPAETPASAEPQATPPTEGTANANRPARRSRRPARNRNANTANSNSGF